MAKNTHNMREPNIDTISKNSLGFHSPWSFTSIFVHFRINRSIFRTTYQTTGTEWNKRYRSLENYKSGKGLKEMKIYAEWISVLQTNR